MTISFDAIPSTLRVPVCSVEFSSTRAQQGSALLAYKGLLIGQKTAGGTAAANTVHRVTSADDVLTLAGRGSMLHRMAIAWFANNELTACYIGVLDDAGAAVRATGTITPVGTATADGTIDLYVGGQHVQTAVASGDIASAIAANIAIAIGKHASGTVTMSSATAGDDVTVAGIEFVASTGAVTPGEAKYCYDTGDSQAATSLAAQINGHATTGPLVYAAAVGAVVTIWAIACGVAGNAIVLTTDDAVHAAVSGSGTLAGATAANDLPLHAASVVGAAVTLHACNKGLTGNDIDVRASYQSGETLPAGITLTIVPMASGATNPTLTSLIAALGDSWYNVVANPYTDATSLTAIEGDLASRWGPMRMIDGVAFASAAGSYATLAALGDTRNSKHSAIITQPGENPLTPPCEFAAAVAAVIAYYGNIDPARPFTTLPLAGVLAPAEADLFTWQERDLLLHDGIATTRVEAGGIVQLERPITTYQTSAAGADDTAYLDVTTLLSLMYIRYSWRARVLTKFPRHKLADDGTRFGAGQAVVTPKVMAAEALAWFRDLEELGIVEDFDSFKAALVIERNVTDRNRLDMLLPPDLVNSLLVAATKVEFLL